MAGILSRDWNYTSEILRLTRKEDALKDTVCE